MIETPKTLAERVAHGRGIKGWSARALSAKAGLSPAAVGLIESGQRTNVESKTLSGLAAALGVGSDWLLAGTGDGPVADAPADPEAKTDPAPAATGTDGSR
jgi:transcriptional regulator with XRE-family HTH domain